MERSLQHLLELVEHVHRLDRRQRLHVHALERLAQRVCVQVEHRGTIVHQLTRRLSEEQMREGGFDAYFVDHAAGVYPQAASGTPWNAASMAVKGDPMADLVEDLAADAATM